MAPRSDVTMKSAHHKTEMWEDGRIRVRAHLIHLFVYDALVALLVCVAVSVATLGIYDLTVDDRVKGPEKFRYEFYNSLQGTYTEMRYLGENGARELGVRFGQLPRADAIRLLKEAEEITRRAEKVPEQNRSEFVEILAKSTSLDKRWIVEALTVPAFYRIVENSTSDVILQRILAGDRSSTLQPGIMERMEARGTALTMRNNVPLWFKLLLLALTQLVWAITFVASNTEGARGRLYQSGFDRMHKPYWRDFDWSRISTLLIFILWFPLGDLLLLVSLLIPDDLLTPDDFAKDKKADASPPKKSDSYRTSQTTREMLDRAEALLKEGRT